MPVEVILPKVDMDMERGTVSTWHAREGEQVEKGAALFDIETDKAAMEVEAPASGILGHVVVPEGGAVDVGAAVAWIYAADEDVPEAPPQAAPPTSEATADPTTARHTAPETRIEDRAGEAVRATPAARSAARTGGVDLASIAGTGSGPGGRLHAADVEALLDRPAPARDAPAAHGPSAPRETGLAVTRRRGSGTGHPILLLHGLGADAAGWAPLERALGEAREIIRLDLPGHGRSGPARIDGFPALARSVVRAFDAMALDNVHIVGHSLGGAVATALADTRPRQVASLGLIAPAGLGPQIDGETLMGIIRASRIESLGPWLQRLAADPDAIGHDFVRAAMMTRLDPELREGQRAICDALFPDSTQAFDISAALARVEAPVSLIWGRSDAIVPWRHALRAPDHAALHLISGTGHIPHIERPAIVADLLDRLFRAAEA